MKQNMTSFLSGPRTMRKVSALVGMCMVCYTGQAYGQLIGNQSIGTAAGSNQPRLQGGNLNLGNTNTPSVNGRFVRGNRARNDFVGSNRSDLQGFVGSTQAIGVGRVQSAVEGLRVPIQRSGNRPLPPQPATGMYYPRLDFELSVARDQGVESTMSQRKEIVFTEAQARIARVAGETVSVVRVGDLAIVRGTVTDQRTAELIKQMLAFEPGIDQIKDELILK
ncbi:hypothetical protein SH449x_001349 [Pirellulaceae bacterium SH449]